MQSGHSCALLSVVVQFDKEVSQTRDYCVAKSATHRAAHPDPSLRKERLLGMTIERNHNCFDLASGPNFRF
jgi:hypothetical protein